MIVLAVFACILIPILVSCGTTNPGNLQQIRPVQVFTVNAPAAGNYPQGLFKYPYKVNSPQEELFTQTLEWSPAVSRTFAANTQYFAVLTLDPVNKRHTLEGTAIDDIAGLPSAGAENITITANGRSLVIKIAFETTANENAPAKLLFQDEFDGDSLDKTKWELSPEWDRQGRSSWRDDMVSVDGGMLRVKFMRDRELGAAKTRNKTLADNWIRAGGIRTIDRGYYPLFENSYGYYEARIKFPVVSGTWGAFWLMSRTQWITSDDGKDGTEIDIVESIFNHEGKYNAALHWNGYGSLHKSTGSDGNIKPDIDIYDGEFHIFALDWSPSEYVFYVDGIEFWRVDGGARFKNSGINQNPNYIKFSVESAEWAGTVPEDFTEAAMLVDYVRVYNQPVIRQTKQE